MLRKNQNYQTFLPKDIEKITAIVPYKYVSLYPMASWIEKLVDLMIIKGL